jgi:hypothetical protein
VGATEARATSQVNIMRSASLVLVVLVSAVHAQSGFLGTWYPGECFKFALGHTATTWRCADGLCVPSSVCCCPSGLAHSPHS